MANAKATYVRSLRWPLAVLAVALTLGALAISAAKYYSALQTDHLNQTKQQIAQAQARLDKVRREWQDMTAFSAIYQDLTARGMFEPQRRLDWVEGINRLRDQHSLFPVEYQIAPQRALSVASSDPNLEVLASSIELKLPLLHEGDLLTLLEGIRTTNMGFYTVDRCALKRAESAPQAEALTPLLTAECKLEWLTMRLKNANNRGAPK